MKWPVLLLVASAALAQEPKFETRAHEVVVPVAVTTKGGKPVESLTASDFVVLNDGSHKQYACSSAILILNLSMLSSFCKLAVPAMQSWPKSGRLPRLSALTLRMIWGQVRRVWRRW